MLDNELNSILNEIEIGKGKGIAEDQSKFKTSDFSLDSILKEYGFGTDTNTVKEPVTEEELPKFPAKEPDELKEEILSGELVIEPEPQAPEIPVKEVAPIPEPEPKIESAISEPVNALENGPVSVPKVLGKKVDIFDNQDIVSMLAANKLGKTNDKGESPKEMTQLFTREQEEDFKMRSGYIDIAAIKAATAAIKLEKEKVAEETIAVNTPEETSPEQKALFSKIGSFFSDTTFRYDTSTVNELTVTAKKKKTRFKKDTQQIAEPEIKEEPLAPGDILEAEDVPNVEQDILSQMNIAFLKAILTGILAIPLALLNLFPNLVDDMLHSLSMANPFNYATANLCFLIIIAIINIGIIYKGLVGLFTLKPSGSTLAALSLLASIIHCVYVMIKPESLTSMFGVIAALSVIFVLIGKHNNYRNVYKNLEILAFNATKTACVNVEGGHSLKELYNENRKTVSCCSVKLLTHFLTKSFDYNFSDKLANISILVGIIAAIVVTSISGLVKESNNVFGTLSIAFATLSPFCFDLAYSLPMNSTSNKIRKTGSAVVSYTVAKEFSNTTDFIMRDCDLFKPDNITVHSMKINGNEKINDVIINCASLIKASDSPVSGAFLNILDNKSSMLMPVTDFDWTPDKGYSGNINGTKYFIGSSQYLADCGIKLPTIDLEEKYKRIGRQVVMFADSRKLLAVFSISYNRDEQIYNNLHKISLEDMKILVLTKDCNITAQLLSEIYEMNDHTFAIASKEEFGRVNSDNNSIDKCPAGIYSITGSAGVTSALANCKRLISTIKISVIFRTIAIASCILLLIYASLTNNFEVLLSAKNIILYHLIWLIPSIFVSAFAG